MKMKLLFFCGCEEKDNFKFTKRKKNGIRKQIKFEVKLSNLDECFNFVFGYSSERAIRDCRLD